MIVDNVEFYNVSQKDSENAGLRFEKATDTWHSVTNCAIHHGLGWGVKVRNTNNVHMSGNVIYYFTRIGVTFDFVNNVTFNDNLVGRIPERVPDEPRGGVLGCTYFNG